MPRLARYTVRWEATLSRYRASDMDAQLTDELWGAWVGEHAAFAFHGQGGHINLRKERRHAGEDGYWYAYRRQGNHVGKRYVGRSAQVTLTRLEALAATLNEHSQPPTQSAGYVSRPSTTSVTTPAPPLLAAKLQPPRLRTDLVPRERLLARLDAGRECALMLIAAPAGFGKTTIVNQWVTERRRTGQLAVVAWFALDAGDADPARFWRYLISACQRFHPAVGHEAFALLHAATLPPFEPPSLELLLTTILNDLVNYDCQGVLVLEDYHVITTPQIHDAMIFFIDHLPKPLHLMLMTRSDPPFPIARWRAQGLVSEIQAPDLGFTRAETETFFQSAFALTPAAADLTQIEARLEGWAAGLRMLAIALQSNRQPELIRAWLQDTDGNQWVFGAYFVAEVLETQLASTQQFLLLTSSLQRLSGALCDAVTQRADSARLLDYLDRAGLFLEPPHQNGEWYRYHALFAEAMRHEARQRLGTVAIHDAARRASAWYAMHDMLPDAIEAAFQGEDFNTVAHLIETYVGPQLFILGTNTFSSLQEFHTIHRWLEDLPEDLLHQRPALCLIYAAAALFHMMMKRTVHVTLVKIESVLRYAEDGWRRQGNIARLGEVFAFRALIARERGAIRESVTWAEQALAWLPADSSAWRGLALTVCSVGTWFAEQFEESRRLIVEAQTLNATLGNRAFVRANTNMLAFLTLDSGEIHRAVEQFRAVLAEARAEDDRDDIGRIQSALAEVYYEWNDLDAAWAANDETRAMSRLLGDEEVESYSLIRRARILHVRGETAQAERELIAMEVSLSPQATPLRARLTRELRARLSLLRLECGDLAAVQAWWDARDRQQDDLPRFHLAQEEALYARLLLAQGQTAEALTLLTALRDEAQRVGRGRFLVHIQALLAVAHVADQDHIAARQMLRATLTRAQPEGYIRTFIELGPALENLIRAIIPELREPALRAYAHTLLRACAQERGDAIAPTGQDELSPQERRVLALLASGRTNPEIAQELVVSINTVKAHIKNLYRKLAVNSRVAATLVARQQPLR